MTFSAGWSLTYEAAGSYIIHNLKLHQFKNSATYSKSQSSPPSQSTQSIQNLYIHSFAKRSIPVTVQSHNAASTVLSNNMQAR